VGEVGECDGSTVAPCGIGDVLEESGWREGCMGVGVGMGVESVVEVSVVEVSVVEVSVASI
jgi:hypothetical protein